VADNQHRSVIIRNYLLQEVKGLEVEIVRRLVEHDRLAALANSREQQPRSLATRQ
jgi:hypothetical protein